MRTSGQGRREGVGVGWGVRWRFGIFGDLGDHIYIIQQGTIRENCSFFSFKNKTSVFLLMISKMGKKPHSDSNRQDEYL